MSWDRELYRSEVLDPARRAGNVPPPDLYVRYALPSDISGQQAFARHIAEVFAYWQELQGKRTYARLADALIRDHAALEKAGRLTLDKFAERQAHSHREQMEQLARLAAAEAATATHVGPVTVARLRSALGGWIGEDAVASALRKAGARVVEKFPELPAHRHPKLTDLVQEVQGLGLRLSTEAVFGDAVRAGFHVLDGFRLASGRRLDEEAISEARRLLDAKPHTDPGKTAAKNILAILSAAARNRAELDALLQSEITERLRQFADSGFVQRVIAAQAHELGLDEDEAGLIAAAMLARDTLGAVRQQVEEELVGGRLRAAQRLAAGLPADDPLRQRVAERDAEVSVLARRADRELAAGRTEQAASLLSEATTMASDDDHLPERLLALAPPPPRRATARVSGDHVLVTWEPSPALAGRVHYRVVRGQGRPPASAAEGTTVKSQTERQDVSDTAAPPGTGLFYSVFASRGGDSWSPPATTRSVMFTPDITGLSIQAAASSVTFTWRAHPGTDSVLVVRAEARPPEGPTDGRPVEASLAGLTDTGLRTGTEYFYRIMASYRAPGGQQHRATGIVVPVVPEPAPEAVTSLWVRALDDGSGRFAATWAPPRYGQVRLVLSDKPPKWPVGTSIAPDEAATLPPVSGMPRRGADGHDFLELDLPAGRHYVIALTMGGRSVIAGDSAEVGLAEPVSELTALRMHDVVRLSWVWPEEATDAVVLWRGGEHHCTRRVYEDEGGVALRVGPAATFIEVRAVSSHPGGQLTAPGIRTSVSGRGVTVNYRILRANRLHPRQRLIEITAEQPAILPALLVVRTTGPYAPDDPAEGEPVSRIEPQPVAPGHPVRVTVEAPKGKGWLACFIDPCAPGADDQGVLLFPPPAEEMRIR